ncbi:MAG: ABC transporter permease, partial [Gemmatimonadaceae bacterium]
MRATPIAFWRHLTRGLRALRNDRDTDRDMQDELAHYAEQLTQSKIADGAPPETARRSAQREVGNMTNIREDVRASLWETTVSSASADVRYALRTLRRNPVFATVVILVIAIGIGSVTTVFSGVNAYLLKPLPGASDASRLIQVDRIKPGGDESTQGSYAYYAHLRDETKTLSGLAAWSKVDLTISRGNNGFSAYGNIVSDNFFSVLRARPALGRFFLPGESEVGRAHAVVVVSHDFWRMHLGADSAIIGKTIRVNGQPYTLVGVASPEFNGVFTPMKTAAWVTLSMQPFLKQQRSLDGKTNWLWVFGRMKDGVSQNQVRAELKLAQANLAALAEEPEWVRKNYTDIRTFPLTGLPDDAHKAMAAFLSVLLAASIVVLIIAGVNIAAMLSARAVARRHEMALRAALGAQRSRLVRQLVTETLVLFTVGAAGGIALAVAATRTLERMPLPTKEPMVITLPVDARVLFFSIGMSALCGIAFGLLPALRAARRDLQTQLRTDNAGSGRRRPIVSNILVVGQLALSMALLVSAALLVRALQRSQQTDAGFDATDVSVAGFSSQAWGYNDDKAKRFFEQLRVRLENTPGISNVSYASIVPVTSTGSGITVTPGNDANADDPSRDIAAGNNVVAPGYFNVIGMRFVEGRDFAGNDVKGSEPVAVINETLAKKLATNGSALAKTFRTYNTTYTVVGVVRDAKYRTLNEKPSSFVYLPLAQQWDSDPNLLVKGPADPNAIARAVTAAVREIDNTLPVPKVLTLNTAMSFSLIPQRVAALVAGSLGFVGLLLATVGLYGIVAYSVGQRAREIGI